MTISTGTPAPAGAYTPPRPQPTLPPPPNTTDELLQQARAGLYGPPPSTMIVTYAFTTRSKSRHVGWANTYANYAVSLRVGRSVGSCLFEPDTVTQEEVEECCARTLDELLDHPTRPVKMAALDTYFAELFPHHESPMATPYGLPEGSTTDKLGARARGVMSLLDPRPGQTVAMIGVIGTMIAWLREHGVNYRLCDFDPQPPLSGDAVSRDMLAVIQGVDGILSTGMTISNSGFDVLLEHCRATGTPLVVYTQSGSHCIPRFLGNGVSGISAEPYPFFWAHGLPSTVYHYRPSDLYRASDLHRANEPPAQTS
jgi:hypothetical protein